MLDRDKGTHIKEKNLHLDNKKSINILYNNVKFINYFLLK